MHLILTGATGLVGSAVLDAMLKTKDISKISILSRRAVKMAEDAQDPRVHVIIHKDFAKYDDPAVLKQLQDADGCVWALGIAQEQVSRDDYIKITKDFALAAATAFSSAIAAQSSNNNNTDPDRQQSGRPFRFVYVAGGLTTTQPGRFTPFQARVKGEAEVGLAKIFGSKQDPSPGSRSMRGYSVRPYAVDMEGHDAITPYVAPRPYSHRVAGYFLTGPIRRFAKDYWAPTQQLGPFLVELAMGRYENPAEVGVTKGIEVLDGGFTIWENDALRKVRGF
ncbi:putative nucleoside-diphosphate-sugar epimerase [Xylariaceae sp. FL0594]|nr:putative nucleoside-diphosphate-sugar epimerase [Xylariaceae sp. FL0594]